MLKYIKPNAVKFADAADTHPALLSLMCREKLTAPKDLEAFTAIIQNGGDAEAIAMVLEYSNNISKKDKEKLLKFDLYKEAKKEVTIPPDL